MRLNKKGFTLVELLVSVTIMALVLTSIFSFVTIVSRFYTRNNRDITVQNEAQTVLTQINNMMVDANVTIETASVGTGSEVYIVSDNEYYVIHYVPAASPDTGLLYLKYLKNDSDYESLTDEEKIQAAKGSSETEYLLAEYVDGFQVTPYFSETENYVEVNIQLRYSQAKNSYSASQNIYLRNWLNERTLVGGNPGVPGGNPADPADPSDPADPAVPDPGVPDPVVPDPVVPDPAGPEIPESGGVSKPVTTSGQSNEFDVTGMSIVVITLSGTPGGAGGGALVFGDWASQESIDFNFDSSGKMVIVKSIPSGMTKASMYIWWGDGAAVESVVVYP